MAKKDDPYSFDFGFNVKPKGKKGGGTKPKKPRKKTGPRVWKGVTYGS